MLVAQCQTPAFLLTEILQFKCEAVSLTLLALSYSWVWWSALFILTPTSDFENTFDLDSINLFLPDLFGSI